jgi:hypothetical protein
VGTAGAYQQSQSAKSQANYQSQVASNNATIAMQNAERAPAVRIDCRGRAARAPRSRRRPLHGRAWLPTACWLTIRVDATGSLLQADLAAEGEYDILKLKDRYAQQVQAAQVQGANFQAEAGLASLKASQQNPGMAAAGSLLGSAGKVYGAGKDAGWT